MKRTQKLGYKKKKNIKRVIFFKHNNLNVKQSKEFLAIVTEIYDSKATAERCFKFN